LALTPLRAKSRIGVGKGAGRAELKTSGMSVKFTFESDVDHWATQETRNVGISKSAPWRALDAGREAFTQAFKQAYVPPKSTTQMLSIEEVKI
jgi:hypothetical protein